MVRHSSVLYSTFKHASQVQKYVRSRAPAGSPSRAAHGTLQYRALPPPWPASAAPAWLQTQIGHTHTTPPIQAHRRAIKSTSAPHMRPETEGRNRKERQSKSRQASTVPTFRRRGSPGFSIKFRVLIRTCSILAYRRLRIRKQSCNLTLMLLQHREIIFCRAPRGTRGGLPRAARRLARPSSAHEAHTRFTRRPQRDVAKLCVLLSLSGASRGATTYDLVPTPQQSLEPTLGW